MASGSGLEELSVIVIETKRQGKQWLSRPDHRPGFFFVLGRVEEKRLRG